MKKFIGEWVARVPRSEAQWIDTTLFGSACSAAVYTQHRSEGIADLAYFRAEQEVKKTLKLKLG
ncbi:hypothetical protein [Hymenobacter sp. AT01-02]|uniref:hypothetical protein n=1 Tax=Hymenobacter sp. AT01-02 TaxID=1571877 RepID=UPI00128F6357|nr:hypothetical protein [Hymenobacter sp. AT01-02]